VINDGDILTIFGRKWQVLSAELGGAPEFLDRRARDIIKREFLGMVKSIIRQMPLDMRPPKIAIRDTTSRWGSCSTTKTISLSYRLSFAPPEVLRYVVIHECCHLKQMNHSPMFWSLVKKYFGPYDCPRRWLGKHGQSLFNI